MPNLFLKKKLFFILFFIFLSSVFYSCSFLLPKKLNKEDQFRENVNLLSIDIEKAEKNKHSRKNIEINSFDEDKLDHISRPFSFENNKEQTGMPKWTKDGNQRDPVIGIILGPGFYKTVAHIGILQSFEKNRIPIKIISGSEMGIIVAALYAKYKSPSRVEWELFKLIQKIKNEDIFSSTWMKKINKYLGSTFEDDFFQKAKVTMLVPMYEKKSHTTLLINGGSFVPLLEKSLNMDFPNSNQNEYYSSIFGTIFPEKLLMERGADIVVSIDVLGSSIHFSSPNRQLVKISQLMIKKITSEEESLNLFFRLNLPINSLDSTDNFADLIKMAENQGEQISLEIKNKINSWKRKNIRIRTKKL